MSHHNGMTRLDWIAAARERFGNDTLAWRFRCPVCASEMSVGQYKAAEAPEGAIAFSCIGRYLPGGGKDAFSGKGDGPCNYAGGGLFRLNPILVTDEDGREHQIFDFAERPLLERAAA